jgi:uncharacterized membrane-anchored protein
LTNLDSSYFLKKYFGLYEGTNCYIVASAGMKGICVLVVLTTLCGGG